MNCNYHDGKVNANTNKYEKVEIENTNDARKAASFVTSSGKQKRGHAESLCNEFYETYSGAVVRHDVFYGEYDIDDAVWDVMQLYFCLALRISSGFNEPVLMIIINVS